MKKKLFLGMAAIAMALAVGMTVKTVARQSEDPFQMNLEVLADGETPYGYGKCWKTSNECMFECPGCHQLVYANAVGPVKAYHCTCGYNY